METNQSNDETPIMVLNLVSWPGKLSAKEFIKLFQKTISELDVKPTYGIISTDGTGVKAFTTKTVFKKVEQCEEHINLISIGHSKHPKIPNGKGNNYDDFLIEVECRGDFTNSITIMSENLPKVLNFHFIKEFVLNVSEIVSPTYGYATCVSQNTWPVPWTAGIGEGERGERFRPNRENRIRAWGEDISVGKHHTQSKLRDLFEFNLLNNRHLATRLSFDGRDITLDALVEIGGNGILKPVNNQFSCWVLNTKQITRLRPILLNSGVLVVPV